MNVPFYFVILQGRQLFTQVLNDAEIERVKIFTEQQDKEIVELTRIAKNDPIQ